MLLVEAGWQSVWRPLASTDWFTLFHRWHNRQARGPLPKLPYTQAGSPAHRLAGWLARLSAWARGVLVPAAGLTLRRMLASAVLSLALGAALGPPLLALTVGVLALALLAVVLDRGRGRVGSGWDGLLGLGLSWLAGHLAFAPLNFPSLVLAAAFSLTAGGAGCRRRSLGQALWTGGQALVAALFVLLRRPLVVPFVGFLLIPSLLLFSSFDNPRPWPRQTWVWLAATMALAAGAL